MAFARSMNTRIPNPFQESFLTDPRLLVISDNCLTSHSQPTLATSDFLNLHFDFELLLSIPLTPGHKDQRPFFDIGNGHLHARLHGHHHSLVRLPLFHRVRRRQPGLHRRPKGRVRVPLVLMQRSSGKLTPSLPSSDICSSIFPSAHFRLAPLYSSPSLQLPCPLSSLYPAPPHSHSTSPLTLPPS